jgi:hypothetical protein
MVRADSLENLSRLDFNTIMDSISAWQNIIRSSAKQRCVILVGLHLQWYWNVLLRTDWLMMPLNPSIANTKR